MNKNYKTTALIMILSVAISSFAEKSSKSNVGVVVKPIEYNFENLTGNLAGGAINNDGIISSITNSTFNGNSAEIWGGAIVNSSALIGEIVDSDFKGNSASYGGAIENSNAIIGEIVDSDFIGNSGEYGGAIYNYNGKVGISAKNDDVTFTGNGSSSGVNSLYNESGTFNLNAYSENRIIMNDGITGAGTHKKSNKIEINNGENGFRDIVSGVDGKSFGVVEFNNKVQNNTVTVNNGTLKLGAYAGETIVVNGTEKSVGPSIAALVNSDLIVSDGAKLVIGTNGNKDSILIDRNSDITVNGTLSFEGESSINVDGDFIANDATLSLEFSDYVQGLGEDETVELDWVIANFESEDAAKDALNGFSNFENDLGIAKNDGLTDLWFDVKQDGSSIKVVGVIPEPATLGLIGLIGTVFMLYRRRFC